MYCSREYQLTSRFNQQYEKSTSNDKVHYEVLVNRQTKDDKNQGTPRNYVSIHTGSTVAVQCEDGGLWTHGTVEGKGYHDHHEISYKICITKTGQLDTRNRKHMKLTQITQNNSFEINYKNIKQQIHKKTS